MKSNKGQTQEKKATSGSKKKVQVELSAEKGLSPKGRKHVEKPEKVEGVSMMNKRNRIVCALSVGMALCASAQEYPHFQASLTPDYAL